jgi:hypothetical protein
VSRLALPSGSLSDDGWLFTSPLCGDGAIAQLGERVLCKHEVVGSIPSGSTRIPGARPAGDHPSLSDAIFISFGIEAHERIVAVDEGPPLQKRPAFRYLTL